MMDWKRRILDVQAHLTQAKVDGWLLYDFHGMNALAREFLQIPPTQLITRRFFYWIPAQGEPVKIVHRIEMHVLDTLPGSPRVFSTWQELELRLAEVLKGSKRVAMEFSPRAAIPYVSQVDGGTIDLVRALGIEVSSSASFLQYYTCVLDEEQLAMHREAAQFLDQLAYRTWDKLSALLKQGKTIDEYGLRMWMVEEFERHGFMSEALPICAINAHSADPHFEPLLTGSSLIQKEDFILIDMWCKKKHPKAVYADITRVAVASARPTQHQAEIYSIVRKAQKVATDYVTRRWKNQEKICGYEIDAVCREVIKSAGYEKNFTHRTGHNIYTQDHGPGANLDGLETFDFRELIPGTCFSIEPGIYLPEEFGIRQEYDVCLGSNGEIEVTGGVQNAIIALL